MSKPKHREADGSRTVRRTKALVAGTLTSGVLFSAAVGQAAEAQATCVSVSGITVGSGCTSAPLGMAIGWGPSAQAHARYPLSVVFSSGSGAKNAGARDPLTMLADAVRHAFQGLLPGAHSRRGTSDELSDVTRSRDAATRRADAEAAAARKKADEDAAVRDKADHDAAAARKKADDDAAAARKKADDDAAAARKKADDDAAAARKKADDDAAAARKKADDDAVAARNSGRLADDDGDLQGAPDRAFDEKDKAAARMAETARKLREANQALAALAPADPQYARRKAEVEKAEVDQMIAADEESYYGGAAWVAGKKLEAAEQIIAAAAKLTSVTDADKAAKKAAAEKAKDAYVQQKASRAKVLTDLKAAQAEMNSLDVLDPKWRASLNKVKDLRSAEITSREPYRFADVAAFSAHAEYQALLWKLPPVAADVEASVAVESGHANSPREAEPTTTPAPPDLLNQQSGNHHTDDGSAEDVSAQGKPASATTQVVLGSGAGTSSNPASTDQPPGLPTSTRPATDTTTRGSAAPADDSTVESRHHDTAGNSTSAQQGRRSENGDATGGSRTGQADAGSEAHHQLTTSPSGTDRDTADHEG